MRVECPLFIQYVGEPPVGFLLDVALAVTKKTEHITSIRPEQYSISVEKPVKVGDGFIDLILRDKIDRCIIGSVKVPGYRVDEDVSE